MENQEINNQNNIINNDKVETKICYKCEQEKPLNKFVYQSKYQRFKDVCIQCSCSNKKIEVIMNKI